MKQDAEYPDPNAMLAEVEAEGSAWETTCQIGKSDEPAPASGIPDIDCTLRPDGKMQVVARKGEAIIHRDVLHDWQNEFHRTKVIDAIYSKIGGDSKFLSETEEATLTPSGDYVSDRTRISAKLTESAERAARNAAPAVELAEQVTPAAVVEAELGLLAAAIQSDEAADQVFETLTAGDFSNPHSNALARAVEKLRREAAPIEAAGLLQNIRIPGPFASQQELRDFLFGLRDRPTAHVAHWVGIVKDASRRRKLRESALATFQALATDRKTDEVLCDLQADLEAIDGDGPARPERFKFHTCAELANMDFRIRFLIDDVFVEHQPGMLGGIAKAGKTTFGTAGAFSLSTGFDFLGRFRVPRIKRVSFLSAESGLGVLWAQLQAMARVHGIDAADIEPLQICDDLPRLESDADLNELGKRFDDHGTEVAFFDPLYLMVGGSDATNLFDQGAHYRRLGDFCKARNITPIILHHLKKTRADEFGPPMLNDLSMSGAAEWCRQWVLLGFREPYDAETGTHKLWANIGGSAGHSNALALNIVQGRFGSPEGRTWEVEVMSAADLQAAKSEQAEAKRDEKNSKQLEADKRKLLDAMVKHPKGDTKSVLRTRAALPSARFDVAIADLIESGDVVQCVVKKSSRKTPFEGFKIAQSEPVGAVGKEQSE